MFWEVLFWKNARDAELLRDDYRWKVRIWSPCFSHLYVLISLTEVTRNLPLALGRRFIHLSASVCPRSSTWQPGCWNKTLHALEC